MDIFVHTRSLILRMHCWDKHIIKSSANTGSKFIIVYDPKLIHKNNHSSIKYEANGSIVTKTCLNK